MSNYEHNFLFRSDDFLTKHSNDPSFSGTHSSTVNLISFEIVAIIKKFCVNFINSIGVFDKNPQGKKTARLFYSTVGDQDDNNTMDFLKSLYDSSQNMPLIFRQNILLCFMKAICHKHLDIKNNIHASNSSINVDTQILNFDTQNNMHDLLIPIENIKKNIFQKTVINDFQFHKDNLNDLIKSYGDLIKCYENLDLGQKYILEDAIVSYVDRKQNYAWTGISRLDHIKNHIIFELKIFAVNFNSMEGNDMSPEYYHQETWGVGGPYIGLLSKDALNGHGHWTFYGGLNKHNILIDKKYVDKISENVQQQFDIPDENRKLDIRGMIDLKEYESNSPNVRLPVLKKNDCWCGIGELNFSRSKNITFDEEGRETNSVCVTNQNIVSDEHIMVCNDCVNIIDINYVRHQDIDHKINMMTNTEVENTIMLKFLEIVNGINLDVPDAFVKYDGIYLSKKVFNKNIYELYSQHTYPCIDFHVAKKTTNKTISKCTKKIRLENEDIEEHTHPKKRYKIVTL